MSEIMIIPANLVDWLPKDQLAMGLSAVEEVDRIVKAHHSFAERHMVEDDPRWRQPIPYVMMSLTGHEPEGRIVMMTRGTGQAESRLHGKRYIGAGGHVEKGHSVFHTALKEVTEELGVPISTCKLRGVLITTGSSVEDVHLCMFYAATTSYDSFDSPEKDLHDPIWASAMDLYVALPDMEKWSQIICRDFLRCDKMNRFSELT